MDQRGIPECYYVTGNGLIVSRNWLVYLCIAKPRILAALGEQQPW